MKVLALIPARGGSKGIPGKNIRPLGGKPVIQWTIETALAAERISRVVVTTDDEAIAACARAAGAEVPFMRPASLASDTVPTLPVIQHALQQLAGFDAVCLLQPTTPFREAGEVDRCIALLEATGADSVVTMAPIPEEHHPEWAYRRDESGNMYLYSGSSQPPPRRQDLPPAFHRDGSVYVTRTQVIETQTSLYGRHIQGVVVERTRFVNLDIESDWQQALEMVERR
ncbi:MAG: acylneuraminate cytidylyltransferase family protein [Acidobacteria bacterium]|nr:acylneuraminate cytidylyltransferase family protein [Acidobacteriota bacterium]